MLEDRPLGQKVTSKPPPEGMMKVDVWSSKALTQVSFDIIEVQRVDDTYQSCMHLDRSTSPRYCNCLACKHLDYRNCLCNSLPHGHTSRRQKSKDRNQASGCWCRGMSRHHQRARLECSPGDSRDTRMRHQIYSQTCREGWDKMNLCQNSNPKYHLERSTRQLCQCR